MPKFRPNRLAKLYAREKIAQEANNIKISPISKILNADGELDISFFESGLDIQPFAVQNVQRISASFSPGDTDNDINIHAQSSSDSDSTDLEKQEIDYPSNGEEEEEDLDNPQFLDEDDNPSSTSSSDQDYSEDQYIAQYEDNYN